MKRENPVLEVKHLKKYYGKIRGIEDVSIQLNKGEIFGFIGPNGSGKSTTIRTIMHLINKTSGTIKIDGKEFNKDDIVLKEEIGYLPSEIFLYEDLTVKEMLDFHESFYKRDIHARRKELVQLLKLDESKKIEDLSLGNAKKLGIILAFMHEPEILILDEPTSGLDPIMQQVFYQLLLEEKKKGTTILYSTHILSEVSKICDRIGMIKEGRIIKEERIEDMEKNSLTYLTIDSEEIEKIKKTLNLKVIMEQGTTIKFVNHLKPNEMMNLLSPFKINKLLVEEVTIEDLFLEYYK